MNLFDKLLGKFGYSKKSGSWDNIWLRGQESQFFDQVVQEAYSQHQTVFMAIDAIATNIPQSDFKMFRGGVDGTEIKNQSEPLVRLFDAPNPLMCRFQLWEATSIYLAYRGEAFWLYLDENGKPVENNMLPAQIWVCDPKHFVPIYRNKVLSGWRYGNMAYSLESVLFFRKFNPLDKLRGFSPLTPIKKIVDLDYNAILYNRAFFMNGAEPMGFLSTEKNLTQEQAQRIREQFEARHKGSDKAKRLAVLEGGLEYTASSESHKDMEFSEQRRYNREEILGTWRVPKSIFSVTDDLNYATASSQKRLFWENTLLPMLRYMEEVLNGHFFPRFAANVICEFDTSDVPELKENFQEKVTMAQTLFNMGFTANEINKRLNLGFDEKDWRNFWWIPFSQIPAGESADLIDESKNDEKFQKMAGVISKQRRRQITWEGFTRSIQEIEKIMASKLSRYFFEVRSAILNQAEKSLETAKKEFQETKNIGDVGQFDWAKYDDLLKKMMNPLYVQAVSQGIKNAVRTLGSTIDFEIFNPLVVAFVKEKEILITRINDTTKEKVRDLTAEAIVNGWTTSQFRDALKESFNFSASRSLMIARTETVGSANGGEILAFRQMGVKKKEWLTARDEFVRESHKELEGVVVNIDQKFPNGLSYAGDPNGDAAEVVNCRCTVLPIIE